MTLTHYGLSSTGSERGAVATVLRLVSGALPPGTYTLQVAAANACGTSAPAPAQTVEVPSPRNSRRGGRARE